MSPMFAWGATMAETRENSIRYIKSGEICRGGGKSSSLAQLCKPESTSKTARIRSDRPTAREQGASQVPAARVRSTALAAVPACRPDRSHRDPEDEESDRDRGHRHMSPAHAPASR